MSAPPPRADIDADFRLRWVELTRVSNRFFTPVGTVPMGRHHVQPAPPDGFTPGSGPVNHYVGFYPISAAQIVAYAAADKKYGR